MKRFWIDAAVVPEGDGFAILLDGRPVRTPAKAPCLLPTRALAEAVAEEWAAQECEVRPGTMPLTRAANTVLDRVAREFDAVAETIAAYGDTDLICYRAAHPEGLVQRQAEQWAPLIDWSASALGAPLILAEGVMHVDQPTSSLANMSAAVRTHDPWELSALHELVTISGSLVIGLAVSRGRLTPDAAWTASRVDEDWTIAEWGEDAEAAANAARRRADMLSAARLLTLVRAD
jgi:chaperone required for assembly of F1-ATPase